MHAVVVVVVVVVELIIRHNSPPRQDKDAAAAWLESPSTTMLLVSAVESSQPLEHSRASKVSPAFVEYRIDPVQASLLGFCTSSQAIGSE